MDNLLYFGDNLKVLRDYILDESVDLIYLDPPFNSQSTYNILFKEPTGEPSKAQISAFDDTWHWTEETERAYREIVDSAPANLVEMMTAFRKFVGLNDVMAYLTMMCIRLVELKRVLRKTGTIYLHCDPTAGHYLKILMDTVFGKRNFRNEIMWCYRGGGVPKKDFAKRHDIILRYSKTRSYFLDVDAVRIPYSKESAERLKYKARAFRGEKVYEDYEPHPGGKHPEDWWVMQPIMPSDKERLGYPTQKPERLLETIIKASSKESQMVLDPFCGCGTAVAVAQRLKRKWIGIDITHLAVNLIKFRLKNQFNLQAGKDYKVIGEPVDLQGARALAGQNRFQFQWWALSLIGARPYGDKKRGPDTGIDGYIYFQHAEKEPKRGIVQVKSGKVFPKDIRELAYVVKREGAEVGVFLTLEEPSPEMIKEAIRAGYYRSALGVDYPKIQILHIEEILKGKRPKLPPEIEPFKKANKEVERKSNQENLDV